MYGGYCCHFYMTDSLKFPLEMNVLFDWARNFPKYRQPSRDNFQAVIPFAMRAISCKGLPPVTDRASLRDDRIASEISRAAFLHPTLDWLALVGRFRSIFLDDFVQDPNSKKKVDDNDEDGEEEEKKD